MADYSPHFTPGRDFTQIAGADVTGGQVVAVSAAQTVSPAGAAAKNWLGVARFDAKAGSKVTITRGGVQRLVASGAITAGDRVDTAVGGKAVTAASGVLGTALSTAVDGALVDVALDR